MLACLKLWGLLNVTNLLICRFYSGNMMLHNCRITALVLNICDVVWRVLFMDSQKKDIRLHEGELNVMELLWSNKELAAKDISKIIKEYIGWEKNTTYTVIKRLIDKGAIERVDPGFVCKAIVSKNTVQQIETDALINKLFNASLSSFFVDYLRNKDLSTAEIFELERIISEQK